MAWLAPRGIVAAAVASLFAFRLEPVFPEEVGALVPIVFLVIVGTVAVYGLTISPVARYLGLAEPEAQGLLMVGAHSWARKVAKAAAGLGVRVLMVDSNAKNIEQAQRDGLEAETANALSESAVDELNLSGIGRLLALTPNDEVNSLAALNFSEVFESNEVYQLASRPDVRRESEGELPQHLRGRPLFGEDTNHVTFTDLFNAGGDVKTFELSAGFTYETLQERYDDQAIPLFLKRNDEMIVFSERGAITPGPGDTLVAFVPSLEEPEEKQGAAPFEQLVARAFVVDLDEEASYEEVVQQASALLAQRVPRSMDELADEFLQKVQTDILPIRHGVALPHTRLHYIEEPELVLVRCSSGLCIEMEDNGTTTTSEPIYALLMLVSPEQNPKQHLQVLANIASRIDDAEQFLNEWRAASNEQQLKETLLHHDRFLSLDLNSSESTSRLIGRRVGELDLPAGNVVTLLHRGSEIMVPSEDTALREGDRITITGDSSGIHRLYQQFRTSMPPQRQSEPEDAASADAAP